jgi:LTXXQ motif family protein
MFKIRSAFAAMALFAGLAAAHAQTTQQDHDAHHPDAPAATATPSPHAPPGMGMSMDKMMDGNMEQMMRTMMGRMMRGEGMVDMAPPMGPHAGIAGLRHIEGQIAFYKAELHITDAQTAQWNAFADALRASAKPLETAYAAMMPGGGLPPVAEQLAKRRQLLAAELDSLQSIEPAARTLYDALSPEQKKLADAMLADHLRRM